MQHAAPSAPQLGSTCAGGVPAELQANELADDDVPGAEPVAEPWVQVIVQLVPFSTDEQVMPLPDAVPHTQRSSVPHVVAQQGGEPEEEPVQRSDEAAMKRAKGYVAHHTSALTRAA